MVLQRIKIYMANLKYNFDNAVPESIRNDKSFLLISYVSMMVISMLIALIIVFGKNMLKGNVFLYFLAFIFLGAASLITYFVFDLYTMKESTALYMTLSIGVIVAGVCTALKAVCMDGCSLLPEMMSPPGFTIPLIGLVILAVYDIMPSIAFVLIPPKKIKSKAKKSR